MKSTISLALVLLTISLSSQNVFAQKRQANRATSTTQAKQKTSPKKAAVSKQANLGTSFRFSGSSLRGKYQSSLGTMATVENDKILDDLLTGRTNFEDRRQQELGRN